MLALDISWNVFLSGVSYVNFLMFNLKENCNFSFMTFSRLTKNIKWFDTKECKKHLNGSKHIEVIDLFHLISTQSDHLSSKMLH